MLFLVKNLKDEATFEKVTEESCRHTLSIPLLIIIIIIIKPLSQLNGVDYMNPIFPQVKALSSIRYTSFSNSCSFLTKISLFFHLCFSDSLDIITS